MGEVVNVVVAFAVIILVVRWATTSSASRSSVVSPLSFSITRGGESTTEQAAARALRFRPKKVTPEMARLPLDLFISPAELSGAGRNRNRNVPRYPSVRPSNI
jgi:coupling of ubiquitin conjugation to ER degradation protein 1